MNINYKKLFEFDKKYSKVILGCDEAGRGPAAGAVYAACVSFNDNINMELFQNLNDSKKLSAKKREELFDIIRQNSYYSIKSIDVDEIEKINILNASLQAMKLACDEVIEQIKQDNILVLADGNRFIKDFKYNQEFIVKGDFNSASIAAASILAKVERDRYMDKIDGEYPQYDWKNNKGYLTKKHIEAIKKYGITKYHRKSFLKKMFEGETKQLALF